jgi:glycosyltransferase involved in cell wall biosynthesis
MTSIVIAAHNEVRTIGGCLDALLSDGPGGRFEIVVAANGCSDATVEAAERPGVVVLDLPQAGKAAALNAAEREVRTFPRVYLDADCTLSGDDIARLAAAVDDEVSTGPRPMAATASRVVETAGRPFIVRHYYQMLACHPAFRHALFGRGVVALSERGRARFDRFPSVLADDFFLDSLFAAGEKQVVSDVISVVGAPSTARVLVRRLARVRRGNREVRGRSEVAVAARGVEGMGWLVDAVRATPAFALSAGVYAAVTAYAVASSRLARVTWGHDQGRLLQPTEVGGSVVV